MRALHRRWTEEEDWGAGAVVEEEEEEEEEVGGQQERDDAAGATPAANETPTARIPLPAPDDPTFGPGGMLHGVLRTRGPKGGITYVLDPREAGRRRRRSAKAFGHNGLAPGAWWPLQIAALAGAAHGHRVAGISGDTALGAYSVVVSDRYQDLDRDAGARLLYSGSNSHASEDPAAPPEPPTAGTRALRASLAAANPVRVLRAGGPASRNPWAPDRGIRYDGLYRVVRRLTPINTRGTCVCVCACVCIRM